MKTFKGDFDMFVKKLEKKEHFALSRWGDGELAILENKNIDLTSKGDGEFKYDSNSKEHVEMRNILLKSYTYQDDNYYIGVACPCCVGDEKYQFMKKLSGQKEDNLTWANIFVNANYQHFLSTLLPQLHESYYKRVIVIANKKGNAGWIPCKVSHMVPIGTDAWVNDREIIQRLKDDIDEYDRKDYVYLFAAGPFANILTYELWMHNKSNTYIDVGSTLDKFLGLTITRGYLQGADTLNKNCNW